MSRITIGKNGRSEQTFFDGTRAVRVRLDRRTGDYSVVPAGPGGSKPLPGFAELKSESDALAALVRAGFGQSDEMALSVFEIDLDASTGAAISPLRKTSNTIDLRSWLARGSGKRERHTVTRQSGVDHPLLERLISVENS